jgi:uncharacterized protein
MRRIASTPAVLRSLCIPLPLLVALVACAGPGPRAERPGGGTADNQPYPNPLDLAAAHVEAAGGRAAVEAVRGYYATGTEGMAGQAPRATVEEWVRPGEGWRKRWDVDGFGRLEHGYDGRVAWMARPDRPSDAVRDEQYREAAASRAVLHPETDLTTHLGAARTIGRREIAGRSTWQVRLTGPAGSVQFRFYDEETGMLRAVDRDELLVGRLTRILTVYDDWRPVESVLFPHRLTRIPASGPERVAVLESVSTVPVPPEAVRVPEEVVAAASEHRYEVEIERDVMVLVRDGVRLATDIHRPLGAGDRLPVILIRTPYDKSRDDAATIAARVFAERGYAVAVQDERGKWASEGGYVYHGWQAARNDGYDTVEWIASQPWSNGRVGTYGCSRRGVHQFMLAAERHPAHVAMIPQAGGAATAPVRAGGAFTLSAAVGLYPRAGTKDRTDGQVRIPLPEGLHHLPTVDIMRHYGVGPTDWEDLLTTPLHDPWWQTHGYITDSDSFATPALLVNSWYDFGEDVTLQLFNLMRRNAVDERTREHQYVIMSPMTHCQSERATENTRVGALDVGDARLPYWQIYLDWFDHWLKGVDNGVTDMPRVQYYVIGANEWRSADEWPVPDARPTRFYLRSGGAAGERMDDGVLSYRSPTANEPPDRYVYDPGDPVPSRGGPLGNPQNPSGAYDQSALEQRADVLVYTTPPLDEPLDVVGPLHATLYVSSSVPDTDFTVKLVDVHPDGRAFNVQEGITRARYREGFDRTVWMRPGEVYEVEVDLRATAYRFRAGHRLRIEVSSSNFPTFDRNLNTGGDNVTETEWRVAENAIHHSPEHPSSLLLHVTAVEQEAQTAPADDALRKARERIGRYMAETGTPGVSVAVQVGDSLVWAEGFGLADVEHGVPVQVFTKFRIWSISKSLTSAAVGLLHEQGRLDLDAPVQTYVPSFPEKSHPITPRQLGGHLSGLPHYGEEDVANLVRYESATHALDKFRDRPLLYEPGERFHYSSFGFNLLGAVVEGAAGRPFLDYMEEAVFDPLGMRDTGPDRYEAVIAHRTGFYEVTEGGELRHATFTDNSDLWAAGGFLSTPTDLVRFGSAILNNEMLRPETRALLFQSMRTADGEDTGVGLGWFLNEVDGRGWVGHTGSHFGGGASLLMVPDDGFVIAATANAYAQRFFPMIAELAELFLGPAAEQPGMEVRR